MYKLYEKPCENCGSSNNYLIVEENRKSIFCEDCCHFEDIYVSEELKKYWEDEEKREAELKTNVYIPKCPICQSTDLSKISMAKKTIKIVAFGIFGMGDNGKTWKCNNCGSKF